jgi:hypothetical protein
MHKEDARYQKLEQLHERRKQVVRLHAKGKGVMEIAALAGLSYPSARAPSTCMKQKAGRRCGLLRAGALRAWAGGSTSSKSN